MNNLTVSMSFSVILEFDWPINTDLLSCRNVTLSRVLKFSSGMFIRYTTESTGPTAPVRFAVALVVVTMVVVVDVDVDVDVDVVVRMGRQCSSTM